MTAVQFRQPLVGEPDAEFSKGFLLAEDEAVHKYLRGMMVPKRPGGTEMVEPQVWFRYPEQERQISYPAVIIDCVGVGPAYELWTSEYVVDTDGLYQPDQSPTLPTADPLKAWSVRPYLAFHITYQVMVLCRSWVHDRYLNSLFFTDIFPPRPFWMGVDADNTWRRTELIDYAVADTSETTESGNKRLFRKVYTIEMMAEIPQERLAQAWQVLRVLVAITEREKLDTYFFNVLQNNPDPIGSIPITTRQHYGERAYYVNDFANVNAQTANAAGVGFVAM